MAQQPAYNYQAPVAGQDYSYPPQAYAAPAPAQPAPQAPAYAQPAPAYAYPPQPAYQQYNNPDEVRTIFVTGFPQDVKERELNNLLRFIPGYEAQGFALFHNGAAAYAAVSMLNNHVFDDKAVLRCEMARKNMYLKGEDQPMKRPRTGPGYGPPPPGPGYGPGGYGPPPQGPPVGANLTYAQVSNTKDNPPCSTLFVGNLGDAVSEAELMDLFSAQPGFVTLKVVRNPRSSTAFVEFADLAAAMAVHDSQQGAVLQTSDRGGIRIQYSKNPFGKKRDREGNPVDPATLPPTGSLPPQHAQPGAVDPYAGGVKVEGQV